MPNTPAQNLKVFVCFSIAETEMCFSGSGVTRVNLSICVGAFAVCLWGSGAHEPVMKIIFLEV